VATGQSNVKWATFKIIANGEDVKIDNMNVYANTSVSNGGLDNGKVFVNGVQVGSTKDITEATTDTNYTFGSSFIVRVGTTAVVDVYADAKTSTSTNLVSGETVTVSLNTGSSNGQGQVSLSSVHIPTALVSGTAVPVAASSLAATKASYYGNQTVIAGAQNVKLGAFTLSAGSTEGVSVNTIDVAFAVSPSSTISDLVIKDHDTGATFGTSRATVGTSNSFSGSVTVAASATKTFDVYANVKSDANIGAISVTTVSTNTTGTGSVTGSSVSVGTAATLQTMTVGSATLTVAQNAGSTPDNANVIAGAGMVKVGSFRFTTQYSPYRVDQVAVKVLAEAATAVSAVILQYKNEAGATVTTLPEQGQLTISSGAQTHATATFTGLTFYVPSDTNRDLDVYVNTPTVASSPSASGKSITVILDYNEGFNATDSSGAVDSSLAASADVASSDTTGKGTMVLRKSYPTLAAGTAPSTTLNAGTDQVLGTFNVTADAAGDVDWGQVVFTVSKTAAVTIGATTTLKVWDVTSGATSLAGSFATTTGDLLGGLDALAGNTSGLLHFRPDSVQTVGAGATRKYELRGTVGGLAAGVNLSVSIATPSTTVVTAAFATVAGATLASAASNPSFVWSDWSDATDHATTPLTATDWASDYLVKTMPLTIGNRSVSF